MDRKFCDCCGKEILAYERKMEFTWTQRTGQKANAEIDLCEDCSDKFRKECQELMEKYRVFLNAEFQKQRERYNK